MKVGGLSPAFLTLTTESDDDKTYTYRTQNDNSFHKQPFFPSQKENDGTQGNKPSL